VPGGTGIVTDSYVRLDDAAMSDLLRSPNGPVGRHVMDLGNQVRDRAAPKVGVSPEGHGIGASGAQQHLRDALIVRLVSDEKGPAAMVGAELGHALFHHEGTAPHVIRPRNVTFLRFPTSPGGATFVFAKQVNHPGTKPNPYLVDAARELGLEVRLA